MTKLYGCLLLLLLTLGTGGCATGASGEPLAQESAALTRATSPAKAEEPGPTAVLVPQEPPASCPVTLPPDPPFDPPGKPVEVFSEKFWYGSDDLYLALPLDGTWSQLAHGEKVFWWSIHYPGGQEESAPEMDIRGRLLDEPGETLEQSGATNASHASFPATAMLHGLRVPSPGCWEITGGYREATLSFVVWVP